MTTHDNKSWIWWDLCIGWVYAWLTAHEGTNQGSYKLHQTNVCQTNPCPRQRIRTPNTKNDTELTQAQIHIKPIVSGKTRCALICWALWEKFDLVTLEYQDKIIIGWEWKKKYCLLEWLDKSLQPLLSSFGNETFHFFTLYPVLYSVNECERR